MSAGVLVGFSLFVYFTGVEDAEQRHALERLRKVEDLHAY